MDDGVFGNAVAGGGGIFSDMLGGLRDIFVAREERRLAATQQQTA